MVHPGSISPPDPAGRDLPFRRQVRAALAVLFVFTLLVGVVYPLVVTALAQLLFPVQANGSLIVIDRRVVGSRLIGQAFTASGYFWSRPSATSSFPYNAAASAASNLGPLSATLADAVAVRVHALRGSTPGATSSVPVDLVTTSGSGLDPHISVAAAEFQVERVARARGRDPAEIRRLVATHAEPRQFGVLGDPRVNVLALNLALDGLE